MGFLSSSSKSKSNVVSPTQTNTPGVYDSDGAVINVQNFSSSGANNDNAIEKMNHSNELVKDMAMHTVNQINGQSHLTLTKMGEMADKAFTYVGEGTTLALEHSEAAREDALLFAGEAFVEAMEQTNRANDRADRQANKFMQYSGEAIGRAFDEMGEASERSNLAVMDSAVQMGQFAADAINKVNDANRSENFALVEKFGTGTFVLVLVLGGAYLWTNSKRKKR